MAQSTLHFALGMAAGSAWALPRVWRCWRQTRPMAAAIGRWLLLAYGLGLYASIPSVLRRITDGAPWATSGWTHVFLLYPLIEAFDLPSLALGELCIAGCFAAQYALILFAIHRAHRQPYGPAR
jgi:hypothetical protein